MFGIAFAGIGLAAWLGLAGNVLSFDAALLPIIAGQINNAHQGTVMVKNCFGARTYRSDAVFVVECQPQAPAKKLIMLAKHDPRQPYGPMRMIR